ncbi:Putative lumazine-binding [Asanoa hainanensis]|uniref:Putative lumazine-binding n=1 Tax=Asanoa hainanensis TaxID=560556 RepID=A0A239PCP9_9ACTN|nr:nuclear transport factor 2 family protein [Asanoa hainanensis]SNT64388.1 Putative lumazine-binding [Asanoa hainanensis]
MDDRSAILATVRDYWDGWFAGDAERMTGALHPDLVKRGAAIDGTLGKLTGVMTADDMTRWTREGEGIATRPVDTTYEVTVDDVYDQIATVTVRSAIYREYLHLVKTQDGWRILNALYTNVS